MDKTISNYIHRHTLTVTLVVAIVFLALAAGEYALFRKQMKLSLMLSEGLIQLKELQKPK